MEEPAIGLAAHCLATVANGSEVPATPPLLRIQGTGLCFWQFNQTATMHPQYGASAGATLYDTISGPLPPLSYCRLMH